jgi:hypothetical protein
MVAKYNFASGRITPMTCKTKQVFFFGNTQIQALLALLLVVLYVIMHVFAKVSCLKWAAGSCLTLN